MPGFFEALEKFKDKKTKKHFVSVDGETIEVSLEQKLEVQRVGETEYFCKKGPNGSVICKKPVVPKEQQQTMLAKVEEGIQFFENNPYWPEGTGKKGYTWRKR